MSDSSSSVPPVTVRPPWPDELPRIAATFPRFTPQQTVHPLIALTRAPGGPERIVGIAGVFPPLRDVAGLTLSLLPRFHAAGPVSALVAAASEAARGAGARQLLTLDELAPTSPLVAFLEGAGFRLKERTGFFSTNLADIRTRVDRVQARLARNVRSETAGSLRPEPLAETHLPAVRALIQSERLLEGEQIALDEAGGPRGYSPRFSFVVRHAGELAGVLLARQVDAATVAVGAEAVSPRWRRGPNLVQPALYRACIDAAADAGIERFVHTANTAGGINPGRMARHPGRKPLRETVRLERPLG